MTAELPWLIPPRHVEFFADRCALGTEVSVYVEPSSERLPWNRLQSELMSQGRCLRRSASPDRAQCVVRIGDSSRGDEAYQLRICSSQIEIESRTDAGAFYALHTLCDLIHLCGSALPCLAIDDEPRLRRRGVYYDCSRGKVPTVYTVQKLIERLAAWKINELQLYIENVFTFSRHPDIGVGFSPFTPEDIRLIQETCDQHHVRLIPSLASLGHMEKILMLPPYQALGELPGYRDWPGGTTLCPEDSRSVTLLEELYTDFLPHFRATDFNVCGDEPWELGQGRSRERAADVGVGRIYLDHLVRLHRLSEQHGKRMNLWGDIVLKHPDIIRELPSDIVLLNWEYEVDGPRMQRTAEFAEAGLEFLCCPGTHGWQSHGTRLQTSFQNIHQFASVAKESGAQGVLITDWGDWGHRNTLTVSLPAMAYGAACAWADADAPDPCPRSYLHRFCSFYQGELGPVWADGLCRLGNESYGYWSYNSLMERLSAPHPLGGRVARGRCLMDEVTLSETQICELLDESQAVEDCFLSGNPDSDCALGDVQAEALLANRMNRASLHRLQLARRLRGGQNLSAAQRKAHQQELSEIRQLFAEQWVQTNRVSRLDDNLQGLDQAIAELS